MSTRNTGPNRRRPWVVVMVALFLLPTFLAPSEVRLELAAVGLAVGLLAAVVRRKDVTGETWRFIAGPPVFLVAVVVSDLLSGVLGGRIPPLLQVVELGLKSLGLGWSVLALLRLGKGSWTTASWRAAVPALIAYLLISVNAGSASIAVFLGALALWGIPTHWLHELRGRTGRWQKWLLVLMTPLAFIFGSSIRAAGDEINISGGEQTASGILGGVQTLLLFVWLTLPARLLLRSFRHLMLGLSIRMRLVLTYVFSTLLPGFLALVLVGVVVFAGIGTLRARVASNLIVRDLETLASQLDHGVPGASDQLDSLTAGLYARGRADTTAATAVAVPFGLASIADSLLRRDLGPLNVNVAASRTVAATPETWIKLAQRGSWILPDTLMVDHEMLSASGRGAAIVAVGNGGAAFVAAESLEASDMVHVLARPLNERVAEGYKRIVGADLMISPTASMLFTPEGSEVTISQRDQKGPAASISTRASVGGGLFHRPIRQGICELRATQDSDQVSHLRGVVVVRTSLAGLVGSLFSTRGLNLVVVVVEGVLAALILIALVFTTIIGFSLNGTITSSMAALKHGAQRLSQGDLDVRVEIPARGEMGRLAESFNRLAHDLKRLVRQVAEKERLDRELQIAREIQVNLQPGVLPEVGGIELAAISRPAKEVAGDYYDAIMVEPGRLVMVVADASGKGVAAAMLVSNLQSALHVLLSQDLPLDTIVRRLNSVVCKNSPAEMFITFFIGVIDAQRLRIDYVNAGHDEPLIIRGNDTVRLGPGGLLLGMFPEARHAIGHFDLKVGDVLTLYSDGVTEAMNASEEEFGVDRLESAIRDAPDADSPAILSFVLDRVRAHTGDQAAPADDLTMLIARVKSSSNAS
ncbi:SpoIIE family protein phosphatase [Candidatus Fermentibacteria bacterium]|nr:SpoIIE family protein phosphatase [Candidatus Fermentibacteria bacterium]